MHQDEHAHTIVENAVYGLNYSWTPAHILMDNHKLLKWFVDAHDQVTDIGQNLSQLHQLIHLQCRMLKMVNQVMTSIKTGEQE
jgi:hypothetical protein